MSDLRIAAEALLQTAQIHQQNFETVTTELQATRAELQTLRQRQLESDQRFEVLLAELRQIKIDSDTRFNGLQTEIHRVLNRLFDQQDSDSSDN